MEVISGRIIAQNQAPFRRRHGPHGGPLNLLGSASVRSVGYVAWRARPTPIVSREFREIRYLRIYLEPGVGYHVGGPSGGYGSAKMMMVLFSDSRLTSSDTPASFFVEIQRRVAFGQS
jgi:hypothetical protein